MENSQNIREQRKAMLNEYRQKYGDGLYVKGGAQTEKPKYFSDELADNLAKIALANGGIEHAVNSSNDKIVLRLGQDVATIMIRRSGVSVHGRGGGVSHLSMSRSDYEKPWFQQILAEYPSLQITLT
jgi:hypothetical protein